MTDISMRSAKTILPRLMPFDIHFTTSHAMDLLAVANFSSPERTND
jgi:hypothetical protein